MEKVKLYFKVICLLTLVIAAGAESGAIGDTFGNEHVGPNECLNQGDPINIVTGNHYQEFQVYRDAGEFPLEFTWYYNSRVKVAGKYLGVWTHSYSDHASYIDLDKNSSIPEYQGKNQIKIVLANGAERNYFYDNIQLPKGYTPPATGWQKYRTGFFRPKSELNSYKARPHLNSSQDKISITYQMNCGVSSCRLDIPVSIEYANASGLVKTFDGTPNTGYLLSSVADKHGVKHEITREYGAANPKSSFIASASDDGQSSPTTITVTHAGGKSIKLSNYYRSTWGQSGDYAWFHRIGSLEVNQTNLSWDFSYVTADDPKMVMLENITVNDVTGKSYPIAHYEYNGKQNAVLAKHQVDPNWYVSTAVTDLYRNESQQTHLAGWVYNEKGRAYRAYHGPRLSQIYYHPSYEYPSNEMTDAIEVAVTSGDEGYEHHNLRSYTNRLGLKTTYNFEKNGNDSYLKSVDGAGSLNCQQTNKSFTYYSESDANGGGGKRSTSIDAKGYITAFSYHDTNGMTQLVTHAKNSEDEREVEYQWYDDFDANDNAYDKTAIRLKSVESQSLKTEYIYDTHDRVHRIVETDLVQPPTYYPFVLPSRTTQYNISYHQEAGTVQSLSETIGGKHSSLAMQYSAQGYKTSEKGMGATTHFSEFNAWGLPEKITKGDIEVTLEYRAGVHGPYLSRMQYGNQTPLVVSYDLLFDRPEQIAFPDGSRYTYDNAKTASGYMLDDTAEITSISGEKIAITVDRNMDEQLLIRTIEAFNSSGEKEYLGKQAFDALGRLYKTIYGENGSDPFDVYTYDKNSNNTAYVEYPASSSGANAIVNSYSHNPHNELSVYYDGRATHLFDSSETGLETVQTPGHYRTIEFVRNGFGQPIIRTDPNTGTTLYKYDASGNLEREIRAYDRVSQQYHSIIEYEYDAYSRLKRVSSAKLDAIAPEVVEYWYDAPFDMGQDIQSNTVTGSSAGRVAKSQTGDVADYYFYDRYKNLAKHTKFSDSSQLFNTRHLKDINTGLEAQVIYPSGMQVRKNYENGRVTQLVYKYANESEASWKSLVNGVSYYSFGPLKGYYDAAGNKYSVERNQNYEVTRIGFESAYVWYYYDKFSSTPGIIQESLINDIYFPALDSAGRIVDYLSGYGPTESFKYNSIGDVVRKERGDAYSNFSYVDFSSASSSGYYLKENNGVKDTAIWWFDKVGDIDLKIKDERIHYYEHNTLG